MHRDHPIQTPIGVLLTLALLAPGAAFAYDNKDAVRDCESRVRSEYGLIDLRESRAAQLPGEKNYRVEGKTKIDGDKYPWSCEINNRRVVDVDYRGRRPPRVGGGPGGGPGGGVPEVVPRRSGEIEVRMPGGCTALYDRDGDPINRGGSCGPGDRRRADDAAASYVREQGYGGGRDRRYSQEDRGDYDRAYDNREGSEPPRRGNSGLDIDLSERGSGRIRFDNGCTVSYQNGRRTRVSSACGDRQIDRADDAVDDYLR
ncbi:hypothetical protein [Thiocystis violacea]|uniref:hypothetical protein n=1 Tax=Thiocystis violacea TaxID=13725 RepID=UPI0019062F8F|nr:hypothetical protein [Thiocystis violacea]MBK1716200.1 hypothetical protein [Thiocystis violacea]